MKPEEIASLLAETELFRQLSDGARLEVARRTIKRSFPSGDVIFHEGDPGDSLLIVATGLVKVFVTSPEGAEMVLATLDRPDTFGELAVIDGGPRSASVRAIEPTILIALRRTAFMEMLASEPGLAEALYRSLGALLRRVLQQASDLVFLDLPGRVAKLLLKLADDSGEPTDRGTLLELNISQSTLAEMVGGSRPTVNQILHAFSARGYVELRGRKILICNPEALRRRAAI